MLAESPVEVIWVRKSPLNDVIRKVAICGENGLVTPDFSQFVTQVLETPKIIQDSMRWSDKGHPDHVHCNMPVFAPEKPQFRLRLTMTAHVRRLPRKCSFLLIMGERIFALDVNPGMIHNNKQAGEKVDATHWTTWPCEVVEPDNRDMVHQQWFGRFLERANINFYGMYERPPYLPDQMDML